MDFDTLIDAVKRWAEENSDVKAIILVGSYARGTNTPTSDIDLCILTTNKEALISQPDIFNQFGKVIKHEIEFYGAVTSIRSWYKDGFEVEYGITDPSWISKPLDNGTRRVLSDGYKVIIDKCNYFKDIQL